MDLSYYKKFEPIDGKWYITGELGSGSFGRVFEIERRDFSNMKSALKVISIPGSDAELQSYREEYRDTSDQSATQYFYGFVREFTKEIQIMSALRGHSNIVSYEDHAVIQRVGSVGWDIFIRMELLTPINKYFAERNPTQQEVIKLGIDMCKALEVCRRYNIIHRDVKPSNIFISPTGDFKLGDFGVARTLEKASVGLSKKGTPVFMAPEVYKGQPYGISADIYSLGIVMYKLLNNNFEPFRRDRTYEDSERALAMRINGTQIPTLPNVDLRLSNIILKACSSNPANRYQTPLQMQNDLQMLISGGRVQQYNQIRQVPAVQSVAPYNNTRAQVQRPAEYMQQSYPSGDQPDRNKNMVLPVIIAVFAVLLLAVSAVLGNYYYNNYISDKYAYTYPESYSTETDRVDEISTEAVEINEEEEEAADEAKEVAEEPAKPIRTVSTYNIVKSDATWISADAAARRARGHLICINDYEEFNKACQMAQDNGIIAFWVGASRGTNQRWDDVRWQDGKSLTGLRWYANEPSYSADGFTEEYLAVFKVNGVWYYNDEPNDISSFYRGKIGYIIETERQEG